MATVQEVPRTESSVGQSLSVRRPRRPVAPWVYYVALLALQLKRVWGMWDYRDMPGGDTCAYFIAAHDWYARWKVNFAWSPLYTAFYGMFLYVTDDAAVATALHRLVIVLAATVLVLAVLRKMLPPNLAWLVAAWWAVLPINFNTMYEVHLFALLPLLAAVLLVAGARGPWPRGVAVALLVLDGFVLRNETFVAAACLLAVCLWWERRQRRGTAPSPSSPAWNAFVALTLVGLAWLAVAVRHNGPWLPAVVASLSAALVLWDWRLRRGFAPGPRSLLLAYALPLVLAVAVSAFFYNHSIYRGPKLRDQLHSKHTVNMGQVYAVGYQQRHPGKWAGHNPWTEFPELCRRQFGTDAPTLMQMIRANPAEVLRHFRWNFRLVPAGVQLLLFSAVSGDLNPDYDQSVSRGRAYVLALSAAAAALFVAGVFVVWRGREEWWRRWIGPRRMGWLALLSVAATSLVIIPTQRPRPSYLFALSVLLMTLLGTAAFALTRRWAGSAWVRRMTVAVMVLLPLTVPGYWAGALPPGPSSMSAMYRRLKPFRPLIDHPTRLFLAGDFAPYVHNYLGVAHGPTALGYDAFDTLAADTTLAAFLDARGVGLLYLDTRGWALLDARFPGLVREFVVTSDRTGWRMIGFGQEEAAAPDENGIVDRCRWALFLRQTPGDAAPAFEPFPGTDQFDGWLAVDGFFQFEGPYPAINLPLVRWGLRPASRMAVRDTRGGRYRLDLCGMTQVPNQHVTVKVDGKPVAAFDLPQGAWPERSIPFDLPAGRHEVELDYSAWESPTPRIDRTVLFKRLRITREREGGEI